MTNPPELHRLGIAEGLRRLLDQRAEQRTDGATETAVLNHRGHRHVVRVANVYTSGAMIAFAGDIAVGDAMSLQLVDQGVVPAQVRWVKDGRIGVVFAHSANPSADE